MLTQQELVGRLREWEVRVTPQRLAIADAVLNSTDHPTVQQIFERVRDHFPSMTLATIYSTLGVLQRSGLVQELPFQKMSRYEANIEPHVNLVCMHCETVVDTDTGTWRGDAAEEPHIQAIEFPGGLAAGGLLRLLPQVRRIQAGGPGRRVTPGAWQHGRGTWQRLPALSA